jgi:hypothetical protein
MHDREQPLDRVRIETRLWRQCPSVVDLAMRLWCNKLPVSLKKQVAQIASALARTNGPRRKLMGSLLVEEQDLDLCVDLPRRKPAEDATVILCSVFS